MKRCIRQLFRLVRDCCIGDRHNASWQSVWQRRHKVLALRMWVILDNNTDKHPHISLLVNHCCINTNPALAQIFFAKLWADGSDAIQSRMSDR